MDGPENTTGPEDLATVASFAYWFAAYRHQQVLKKCGVQASLKPSVEEPGEGRATRRINVQTPASETERALALLRETVLIGQEDSLRLPRVSGGFGNFLWVHFFLTLLYAVFMTFLKHILFGIG